MKLHSLTCCSPPGVWPGSQPPGHKPILGPPATDEISHELIIIEAEKVYGSL